MYSYDDIREAVNTAEKASSTAWSEVGFALEAAAMMFHKAASIGEELIGTTTASSPTSDKETG